MSNQDEVLPVEACVTKACSTAGVPGGCSVFTRVGVPGGTAVYEIL